MKTFFSLLLLVAGIGLCLFDKLLPSLASAHPLSRYRHQLDAWPNQETYSKAQYTAAAWQAWTNRVSLEAKDSYTVAELKEALFGLGTEQTSCDRQTFEALIAEATGYHRDKSVGTFFPGLLAMLFGAFMFGGIVFQKKQHPPTTA